MNIEPEKLTLEQVSDLLIRFAAVYVTLSSAQCPTTLRARADAVILAGGRPQIFIELGEAGALICTAVAIPAEVEKDSEELPTIVQLTNQLRPLVPSDAPVTAHKAH